jgi:hypothetical protein
MNRVFRFTTIVALTLTAACSSYQTCLEETLAGKTADEKRMILAEECRKEIAGGLKPDQPPNVRHFQRLKTICTELSGKPVPFPTENRSRHAEP